MEHFSSAQLEEFYQQYDGIDELAPDLDYFHDMGLSIDELKSQHGPLDAIKATCNLCIRPTLIQTLVKLYPIVVTTLLLRIIIRTNQLPPRAVNIMNVTLSLIVMVNFFNVPIVFYITALISMYAVVRELTTGQISGRVAKPLAIVVSAVHLFTGELVLDADTWLEFRGAEMITIMKGLSLVFDMSRGDNATKCPPQFAAIRLDDYLSYMLSVETSIFGPWMSYQQHVAGLRSKLAKIKLTEILAASKFLFYSLASLIVSNCLFGLIDDLVSENTMVKMYFKAFSFRHSNYFVLYFSQFVCHLGQIGVDESWPRRKSATTELTIVEQSKIELPRSLVHVVTSWNIPMHVWLKKYVFVEAKRRFGLVLAMLTTYFVSSALHGFDAKIVLVLFSISLFAYVESEFRTKLSKRLSACVGARDCHNSKSARCGYAFDKDHIKTKCVNTLFTALSIYHLAYLGQLFYFESDYFDKNSSQLSIALNKWSETFYSSHVIAAVMFMISRST